MDDPDRDRFERQLDFCELTERTIERYNHDMIDILLDDPLNGSNQDVLMYLCEYALNKGKRQGKAWEGLKDALNYCKWFTKFRHAETERMYAEWLNMQN